MIDPIGGTSGIGSKERAPSTAQAGSVRSTAVLNAVQSSSKTPNTPGPLKVFSVTQPTKSGSSTRTKLPRGSLVDVLA